MGAHVRQQPVDLRVLLRVGLGLEADVGRVVAVVGVQVAPGGREHDDQRHDAQSGDDAATGRPGDPSPAVLGEQGHHALQHEASEEHEADPGQQEARELHAHLEAPDEDVAAARHNVVEGPEGRPPERHDERDQPDEHEGATGGERAPAPDAEPDAHGDEDGDDGPAAVVVEMPGEQPGQHLPGAVAVLEPRALEHLVARRPMRLLEQRDDDPGRGQ